MSSVFVHGWGAVSPAGWGAAELHAALKTGEAIHPALLPHPNQSRPLLARPAPPPSSRPGFLGHPRLRRSSPISQYVVAAGLEALGGSAALAQSGALPLGIIVCVMTGSVAYSRRFYEEVLREPSTASPLIFPETVFNAPASHLGAYLNTAAVNCTLVGDEGTFLQGLALGACWLIDQRVDACLVIGAEESDWIISDALRLFDASAIHASGAGALLLKRSGESGSSVELAQITDSFAFTQKQSREAAAVRMRAQLPAAAANELLCASSARAWTERSAEAMAWHDWNGARWAPKSILGEGFCAAAAWQCVAACLSIQQDGSAAANVSVVGSSQQAIGARFVNIANNGA